MKILSALTYYAPHWTGLTMHAQRVAEGLAARGHHVTVLTIQHEPTLPTEEILNGVHVLRLKPAAQISRGMLALNFPFVAAKLIRSHDVVHVHTPQLEALLLSGLCRMLNKPLLMSHHGDLVMPTGLVNRAIEKVMIGQMVLAGKLARRVSAYSRDYAAHSSFLQKFSKKLTYIYPPVELPTPIPSQVAAWKSELGISDKPIVGFAGRFVEEKGFDFLLKAMPMIAEVFPEVRFVFAGEHKMVYEDFYSTCLPMIEQNRERIVFLGLLRDPQKLANFYAMCDLFTLPSRTDCLAMVQIEALLAGTPLVTSDIPGARVVVQETGFGRLVETQNPRALADGIIEVLKNPQTYKVQPAKVEQVFSVKGILDSYERTMAEMCGQPVSASVV
ncbi:glycosyltransferase family 4 protein [Herpetosiphon giganteus]|uniref:glycosyltransferase family 4 protein n=1 Tax=Herpetosiphon giganteus TaxID=2029754 RepID=UPI001959F8B0|nr:glycosyltransferase family 4 protein [Herpetosiphon giganteus]MBM7842667.1 glycosyltransferase involved in cell wall biosynthesis [Herpetosiphon giganteus]